MEAATESVVSTFALESLSGDLAEFMVNQLRALPKPWTVMSEAEQREMIERTRVGAERAVRNMVTLLASDGRPSIEGALEKFDGDSKRLVLKVSVPHHGANADRIFGLVGGRVLIVHADAAPYLGGGEDIAPDPDQPGIFDGDNVAPFRNRDSVDHSSEPSE